jgi:hypothetical protein
MVDQRRGLAAASLGHAELEAGQRLLQDQPPDLVPLVVVAVQQPRPGPPTEDRGQLLGQVVGVLHAGAAPSPPVGGTTRAASPTRNTRPAR